MSSAPAWSSRPRAASTTACAACRSGFATRARVLASSRDKRLAVCDRANAGNATEQSAAIAMISTCLTFNDLALVQSECAQATDCEPTECDFGARRDLSTNGGRILATRLADAKTHRLRTQAIGGARRLGGGPVERSPEGRSSGTRIDSEAVTPRRSATICAAGGETNSVTSPRLRKASETRSCGCSVE